jgi:quinol monooxygenase YgiN
MYIRVTRGQLDPARYAEFARINQEVAAVVKTLPGCQSFIGAGDRAAGKTIAVSTWDTAEHAGVSRDALGDVQIRLLATGIQLEPPEIYEAAD